MALAALVFLVLATYQLDLPGLHYDEAKEAGNNAVQLLRGQPVQAFRGSGVRVGSALLPVMVQDYIGALNVYLAVPFLRLLGVSVPALRALPVALGAGTLCLIYALTREMYGRIAAIIASLLLAVNPSFVFWSRQGIFVTNVSSTLAVATALAILRWWQTRRVRYVYVTASLCALGIYSKLLFVWAVVGYASLILVILLAYRRNRGHVDAKSGDAVIQEAPLRQPRPALVHVIGAITLFVIVLLPLFIFNIQTGGTLTSVLSHAGSSYYGVSNAAFWLNLLVRVRELRALLRGDHLWYLGGPFGNGPAPWIAAALGAFSLVAMSLGRNRRGVSSGAKRSAWWMPALFCLLVMVQSSFTISDLFITHYAIVLPFIAVAISSMSAFVVRSFGRGLALPVLAVLLWWGVADTNVTLQYHRALTDTGGHAAHSDAIYKLSAYLSDNGISAPLAMDWGIEAPVYFLSEGQVQPVEVFGYDRLDEPDAAFDERLTTYMARDTSVYVFHWPDETVFEGRREAFDRLVSVRGLTPIIDAVFYERSGSPLFVVARLATS
jgi:hypothetical protein